MEGVSVSGFADRVAKLMERVEYRRADTPAEKQAIQRMRHEAYTREGYIEPQPSGLFTDPDDESRNAWLIALYIDGEIASSLRLHVASRPGQRLPVLSVFSDVVASRLRAGQSIIDATRHTSRFEFARLYPQLPYLMMRAAFLAEDHFGADYITAALRAQYQGAYRRMYNAVAWAAPRAYPPMQALQTLLAYDCAALRSKTRARYPFLASTPAERQALFGRSSNCAQDLYLELTGREGPEQRRSRSPRSAQTAALT